MPLTHRGALSGVDYSIPALADVRDPSKAFADFADTLPPTPAVLATETITGDKTASVNHLYLYEGSTPVTVTLPASGQAGDRVLVYQLGTGTITVSGIGVGTPVTTKQYDAVTAVWDGARWVGAPFSFSGTRPAESSGGVITDLNGFRYHSFDTPGIYTFVSHKDLSLEAVVLGGGGGGEDSSVGAAGPEGQGGVVVQQVIAVDDWTFTTVIVGSGGAQTVDGQASSFGATTAAGGKAGKRGSTTPPSTPVTLTGDWAVVAHSATVGGPGGVGPAASGIPGRGGGGGYDLLAPYPQETETYTYTTGGPYTYDCSYPARAENYQSGWQRVVGDPCVNNQCPGGWRCEATGYNPVTGQAILSCVTDVPVYSTRYLCDSGGSLSGTTCVKTCSGDNTQVHTGTRPKACNAGYSAVSGQCVDSRTPGGGRGEHGLVIVRYAHP